MSVGPGHLRDFISGGVGRLATALMGAVTFGMLARGLGTEGLREYRTVLTLILLSGILFDLGLYSLTLRDLARADLDPAVLPGNLTELRISGTVAGTFMRWLVRPVPWT